MDSLQAVSRRGKSHLLAFMAHLARPDTFHITGLKAALATLPELDRYREGIGRNQTGPFRSA